MKTAYKMKKILLVLSMFILLVSCDNDDNEVELDNLSNFLESTTPQFFAFLDDQELDWKFGFGGYQTYIGYFSQNNDFTNPSRYLEFVLNQENGDNQFLLRTPIYDTSSDIEFNIVFGTGLKTIGKSEDEFFISLRNANENYSLCNSGINYEIEILKTEEIFDGDLNQTYLNVWIKLSDLNLNECDPNYNKSLTNGLILARFYGHKFE